MTNLLATRYAGAFYELCSEEGAPDAVYRDLVKVRQLTLDSPEFAGFLKNPSVTPAASRAVLKNIFKSAVSGATLNFLLFLAAKRRLSILPDACDAFERLYNRHREVAEVKITGSIGLTKAQVELLCQGLKKQLGRDILPAIKSDPALIGGFKIQVEDKIYDYSIKTQLEKFKEALLTA